jgi:hypothetical protein
MAIGPTDGRQDNTPALASLITGRGVRAAGAPDAVPVFRRWMMSAMPPPSLHEDMLNKMAYCGVQDLPEMIEAVEQAEQVCWAEVQELHGRARRQSNERDGNRLNIIAVTVAMTRSSKTLGWLEEMRRYLTDELTGRRSEFRGD